jgi:hypothetical protein
MFSFCAGSDEQGSATSDTPSVDVATKAFAETRFFAEQNIHDIPSEKMNEMTAQERNAGFYDLHGVPETLVKETPELIAEKLAELEAKMDTVGERFAYDTAKETSEYYVKSLRLAFLRAENFDTAAAALRMARHFDFRLAMFGHEVLGRDICLSDLPEPDRKLFEKGFLQICRERDRAGRQIQIQMMRKLGVEPPPESTVRYFPSLMILMVSRIFAFLRYIPFLSLSFKQARLFFFLMCTMGSLELTQKRGVILMEYMVGIKVEQLLSTQRRARTPLFLRVMAAMPVRLNALHVCFDDPRIRSLFKLLTSVIEGKLLCRLQSHYGTDLECLYSLMAYGIPPSCLPVQTDGSIDTTQHKLMLSELSSRDSSSGGISSGRSVFSEEEDEEVSPPTSEDVLMGRGRHGKNWPGNYKLRKMVENTKGTYKASSRDGKIAISQAIYDELIHSGARFLVPCKNSKRLDGGWIEMPRNEACIRIAHLFRNLRAAERSLAVPQQVRSSAC